MTPLFGYGTFCNTAWREAIFGASYAARDATLRGWRRTATAAGYLSIEPAANDAVAGVLIELDDAGWAIADAWEEVPRYRRIAARVETAGGIVDVQAYVCDETVAATPFVDDGRFAMLPDAAVEAAIARFVAERRADSSGR